MENLENVFLIKDLPLFEKKVYLAIKSGCKGEENSFAYFFKVPLIRIKKAITTLKNKGLIDEQSHKLPTI